MSTTPTAEPAERPGTRTPHSIVRRAMLRFAAVAALGLLAVSLATIAVARSTSRDVAVRDAVARGGTFARTVSGPLVSAGVRDQEPESVAVFSEVMRNRLEESSMVHIRVWDPDGTLLWADDEGLQGQQFVLEDKVKRLFLSGGVVGSLSRVDKPRTEADDDGELLEVYAAAVGADGRPVVVESYWSTEQIQDYANAVMRRIAPLSVGALLVFALVVFPLAWSLARRVDRVQGENNNLLKHALAASDLERRRIARDLHDGVMQDVSGAGYALSAIATSLPEEAERPRRLVQEVAVVVQRISDSLRSTLVDIYPANLATLGLGPAVEELAARASETGVDVQVDVFGLGRVPLEVTRLSYRVIREGLRNVVRHSGARHAHVLATCVGDTVYVSVEDDGRGLGRSTQDSDVEGSEGHVGLALLADTVRDVGGTLRASTRAGGGTQLAVSFPRRLSAG